MASSTTRPTDNTMGRMVSRLREKPTRVMAATAPSREMGMVIRGTRAVRSEPISASTTMPTRMMVSTRVIEDLADRIPHVQGAVVGGDDLHARRQGGVDL